MFLLGDVVEILAENAKVIPKVEIVVVEDTETRKYSGVNASVYIDDEFVGITDNVGRVTVNNKIVPGYHIIEVKKPGFFTYKAHISFSESLPNIPATLYATPEKVNDAGYSKMDTVDTGDASTQSNKNLKITVLEHTGTPLKGAKVFIDAYLCGETDAKGVLKKRENPGRYVLKVEKDGFRAYSKGIELIGEYLVERVIALEKLSEPKKVAESPVVVPQEKKLGDKADITAGDTKKEDKYNTLLKIRVSEEAGAGKLVPLKGAKVLIDDSLCGETNKDGRLIKKEVIGKHILKVVKDGYNPYVKDDLVLNEYEGGIEATLKKIPISDVAAGKHKDTNNKQNDESVQKKREDINDQDKIYEKYYYPTIIGSGACILGVIAFVVIILVRKKGAILREMETIVIEDIVHENHHKRELFEFRTKLRLLSNRDNAVSSVYIGDSPFRGYQQVVFKVLKEKHHDMEWLFIREKDINVTLENNGVSTHLNHVARYLSAGFLMRNKKQMVLVFEYVEGESLPEIISKKKYTLREAIIMGIGLCEPLMFVHNAGFCHLDLKPEHFIHRGQNRFSLIDIATALNVGDSVKTVFVSGKYSSPEQQIKGTVIDQVSDIYALGVILEELVYGSTMISDIEIMHLVQDIKCIVGKMRHEHRDARYQHILEVQSSLAFILTKFGNV